MHKKFVVFLVVSVMFLAGMAAYAENNTVGASSSSLVAAKIAELQAQIKALQAQIETLQASNKETKTEVRGEVKEIRAELKLSRSLFKGSKGDDVRALQELLATDPDIYPENLITGFYGKLTEDAVKRFQKKHGIEALGIVGPQTRDRILSLLGLGSGTASSTVVVVVTPGLLKQLSKEKVTICHIPPGNPSKKQTLTVASSALKAHLAHGDILGSCDEPDTTAPVISQIAATNMASTTAQIIWQTNELSDSKVWYGATTPVSLTATTTPSVASVTLILNHNLSLSGLTASTTYYFIVGSKDVAGNTATSSERSFATTVQ